MDLRSLVTRVKRNFSLAPVWLYLLLGSTAVGAAETVSPCQPTHADRYPATDASPAVGVWHQKELLQENWTPPAFTEWSSGVHSRLLVILAGRFRFDGSMNDLLDRIGAISSMRTIRYWSESDNAWRRIAEEASALNSSNPASRRSDFKASDMNKGDQLFYWEKDDHDRETVYRLNVYANSPDCFVLANENVTPIKRFIFTIFRPATLQSVLVLQRLSADTFGVYMLNRTDQGASALSDRHENVYENRAIAFYRQLAGVKTDIERPPAEWSDLSRVSSSSLLKFYATIDASGSKIGARTASNPH